MIAQLSVLIPNKPGAFARVVDIMSEENVNCLSVSTFDARDFGVLYLIVDQPQRLQKALEEKGYSFVSAEVEMVPQNYITLSGEGDVKNMQKLIDMLEDSDDVQNVWHNWDNN